jgi:hypothetical protein
LKMVVFRLKVTRGSKWEIRSLNPKSRGLIRIAWTLRIALIFVIQQKSHKRVCADVNEFDNCYFLINLNLIHQLFKGSVSLVVLIVFRIGYFLFHLAEPRVTQCLVKCHSLLRILFQELPYEIFDLLRGRLWKANFLLLDLSECLLSVF